MKMYKKILLAALVFGFLPITSRAVYYVDNSALFSVDYGVDTSVNVNTNVDVGADVNVTSTSSASGSVSASAQTNMQVFEENLKATDSNVEKIDASNDDEVKVEYKHKGRFLGIFPVMVKSVTSVTAQSDGKIETETKMPWWNIFVTGTGDIDAEVDQSLSTSSISSASSVGANASLSANTAIITAIVDAYEKAALDVVVK